MGEDGKTDPPSACLGVVSLASVGRREWVCGILSVAQGVRGLLYLPWAVERRPFPLAQSDPLVLN